MQVGQAAPIVAALINGTDKETVVSEQYGGSGGQQATTDEVYQAIGNVSSLGAPKKNPLLSHHWTWIVQETMHASCITAEHRHWTAWMQ